MNRAFELGDATVPIALAAAAGLLSVLTWWSYPRKNLVAFFQLLDVSLYGACTVAASAYSSPPASYIFLGLFMGCCLYWGQLYFFSALRILTISAGPLVVELVTGPDVPTMVLIAAGVVLYASVASTSREKKRLLAHRDRSEDVLKRIDELFAKSILGSAHLDQVPLRTLLHDVKNELSFAAWNLGFLQEEKDQEKKKIVDDIRAGILHAFSTAQGYFDQERSGGATQIFWVSDLPQALEEVPSLAGQKERLAVGAFPELTVRGSSDLLVSALRNLIENSLDAGASRVSAAAEVKDNGQSVLIKIDDDGPGLPLPVREKIFTPFNTHGKMNGVGLGIYLSKRIVETMNGKLALASTGKTGTSFHIALPVTPALHSAPPEPEELGALKANIN